MLGFIERAKEVLGDTIEIVSYLAFRLRHKPPTEGQVMTFVTDFISGTVADTAAIFECVPTWGQPSFLIKESAAEVFLTLQDADDLQKAFALKLRICTTDCGDQISFINERGRTVTECTAVGSFSFAFQDEAFRTEILEAAAIAVASCRLGPIKLSRFEVNLRKQSSVPHRMTTVPHRGTAESHPPRP